MSPLGIREYALIAVVLALGALGWRWWHLEGQVREQGAAMKGLQTAVDTANQRLTEMDTRLATKLTADAAARTEVARRERGLEELKRDDPTVREWADTPIPVGVRDLDAPGGGAAPDLGADPAVRD